MASSCTPSILLLVAIWIALFSDASGAARKHSFTTYRFDIPAHFVSSADQYRPWAKLAEQLESDAHIEQACRSGGTCPRHMRGYFHVIDKAKDLPENKAIALVNQFVNRRHQRTDIRDQWRTPSQFLRLGGDCEDFALTKYFMLREVGFDPKKMRMVVARLRSTDGQHAVLAIDLADGVKLLDIDGIRSRFGHREYRFLYSVNEVGIWDHTPVTMGPRYLESRYR